MRQRLNLRPRVAMRLHAALVFSLTSVVFASWFFFGFNMAGSSDASANGRMAMPVKQLAQPHAPLDQLDSAGTATTAVPQRSALATHRILHPTHPGELNVRSETFQNDVGTPSQSLQPSSVLRPTANAARRTFNIPVNVSKGGAAVLRIFSSTGYCMSSRQVNLSAGDNRLACEAEGLPSGDYQLVLDIQGDIRTGRVTKNW